MTKTNKPQRITRIAAPGTMLKPAFEATKRIRLRENLDRDPVYIQLVQECPCLNCGIDPCGEAAHVRMPSGVRRKASSMGKTPPDRWALPLCRSCHQTARDAQHKGSEREFWFRLGIPALDVCEKLYAKRGDLIAMRAVCFVTIAERESHLQRTGVISFLHGG